MAEMKYTEYVKNIKDCYKMMDFVTNGLRFPIKIEIKVTGKVNPNY